VKTKKFSQKEQLRMLDKFCTALYGESWWLSKMVMQKILEIEFLGLSELKKKYKMQMKLKSQVKNDSKTTSSEPP
jgi:hypothetical protein